MSIFSRTPKNPFQEIEKETTALNSIAGSWPLKIKSEDDKKIVIANWMKLLNKAQACYEQHPEAEEAGLCALADLYRQGHNLGVQNCALNADQAIRICLSKFPKSTKANLIGSFFYVSIPNGGLDGENCLRALQEQFGIGKNEEVERGLLYALLNQQRQNEALEQANYYISIFGENESIASIRTGLEKNTLKLVNKPLQP